MTPEQRRKQLHTLVTLLLLPLFMMAAAGGLYWMNASGITLFGSESRSRGELLASPYPSLSSLPLQVLQGEEPIRPAGARSWTFLHVGEAHCDSGCERQLWESRQTKLAMGRLSDRVRRAYIVLDAPPDDAFLALVRREHPDLSLWQVSRHDWQALLGTETAPVKLYFADRTGYVMMRYREAHTYKDIMKDMNFLIRHN